MTILALNLDSALFEMKCTLYHIIISLAYSEQAGENKSKQRGRNVEK